MTLRGPECPTCGRPTRGKAGRPRIDSQVAAKIQRLWDEGYTAESIGKVLRVSTMTVRRYGRKERLPAVDDRPNMPPQTVAAPTSTARF